MNDIGIFVRTKRKELGLTQETLATYARTSAKFIVELESGKLTLKLNKVIDVLKVFDSCLEVRHI
ncbi:MAG: helix-turn-helix transcriptional regulator [Bacilli bacterium]|nr:helix-turn-helix transcriptional regulator [Bacilli bacterium]